MFELIFYTSLFGLFGLLGFWAWQRYITIIQRRARIPAKSDSTDSPLSPASLDAIDKEIEQGDYGILHSLVVIQNDDTVFEKYYHDWKPDQIHDLQSTTKSVLSILIGIAIDKGYIRSVEEKIDSLLPNHPAFQEDPQKKQLRLKHLLTMSAGLEWDEQSVQYRQPGNTLTDMYAQQSNWQQFILQRPLVKKPGTTFNYNSGLSIVLGDILQRHIGSTIQTFAEQYLFQPLGIEHYQWSQFAGVAHCGGGLYLKPSDMARLGKLCLNGGRWNGKQIVPAEWIAASLTPRFRASADACYGYHWWTTARLFNLKPIVYAAGNGWQFIYVIREFSLVIVTTGRNYSFEELRSTMTQNELIFSILCARPAFLERIDAIYQKQILKQRFGLYEAFMLAYCLNRSGAYQKTIRLLEKQNLKYESDFRINFMLGEAYLKTGQEPQARKYLEYCISYCDKQALPQPGYYAKARDLIRQPD